MATVRVTGTFRGTVHQAECCWYDTARWPSFMDEVARVIQVSVPWPEAGGSVVWESGPAGRGRVSERVVSYEPLSGQTVAVEDATMTAEQTVWFVPAPEGVEVVLELEYRIKRRNPLTPLIDVVFIRRLMAGSLARTLTRFGSELETAVREAAR